MYMRKWRRCAAAVMSMVLSACGGGGSDSTGTTPPVTTQQLVGRVWLGAVAKSTVTAYRLTNDGARTPLGSAVSAGDGTYLILANTPLGSVVQIEATGGTYSDAGSGTVRTLDVPLRLTYVVMADNGLLSISAMSEVASRVLDASFKAGADLASAVDGANQTVAAGARLQTFLGVDFYGTCADSVRCDALVVANTVSTMQRRWGVAHLEDVLQRLTEIWRGALYDDLIVPELVRAEFDQSVGLNATTRAWTLGVGPITADDFPRYYPAGTPGPDPAMRMPDGNYFVLEEPPFGDAPSRALHRFNQRGALSAIEGSPEGQLDVHPFSTVTDGMFTDGEVAIGRWVGGFLRGNFGPSENGTAYAVGIPAPDRTDCAFELFNLTAATAVSPLDSNTNHTNPPALLLPGSQMSIQHLGAGHARLTWDLTFQLGDGSTQRIQRDESILQAWRGVPFREDQSSIAYESADTGPTPPSGVPFSLSGPMMRAGANGDKIVARMAFNFASVAAVFTRTDTVPPRDDICAADLATASPIATPPTGLSHFFSRDIQAEGLITWKSDGSPGAMFSDTTNPVQTLAIDPAASTRELVGARSATIGRIYGAFPSIFTDEPAVRSVSYATAVEPNFDVSTPPMSFHLKSATTPLVRIVGQGWTREVVSGHIDSATLSLTPGINQGIVNPFSGEGTLTISGVVAGIPYHVEAAYVSLYMRPATFFGDSIAGAVADQDAQHAVVVVRPQYGSLAEFSLLLERD
jgi:hypothetical protein